MLHFYINYFTISNKTSHRLSFCDQKKIQVISSKRLVWSRDWQERSIFLRDAVCD